MLVTILDNSVPFDGRSADAVPLGGPEKGVIALAVSLAKRGHTVRVFNRCEQPSVVDSVSWRPITECDAAHSDCLSMCLMQLVPRCGFRARAHISTILQSYP